MVREGGRGGWIATSWEGDKSKPAAVTRLISIRPVATQVDARQRLFLLSSARPENFLYVGRSKLIDQIATSATT